jgi:hypothetical protein
MRPQGTQSRRRIRRAGFEGTGAIVARGAVLRAALVLLPCLGGARGEGSPIAGDACGTLASPSVVTGSASCGVRVNLYYPGQPVNVSRPYSVSSGTIRVGFAVSAPVPSDQQVQVLLPAQREGFAFNYGGESAVVPVVTSGGTEAALAMHGTGMPTFTVETKMDGNTPIGQLITVTFGSMGTPTIEDAKAGYEFDLTNVRNPYPNAGLPIANVEVNLMRANGSIWYHGSAPLPEFVPGELTTSNSQFELISPEAGIQTDIRVTISTRGWIPTDGRMEILLPPGFILTSGSTVAIVQTNLGEENALYVSSLDVEARKITLVLAGALGFNVSPLPPLFGGSFQLTKIRNPYSGITGVFGIRTFSGSNHLIDAGSMHFRV